ncbi:FAD-dependent oxidoreductase [Spiroplasma turonicum]|uniref:NADH oxidase n=1 Tax=Spiroplasma turonicum TaxID=216946 RepID=A0A0K1P736_9MOLU|nr:FAD-dependent oxidoreductase [Spiroplasma turonicum]AKU80095.1 NADH oxidase [Spiroplasma turonicum]ALX71096.1 NADH oxidase [Spiroplasma turonicum]
MKVIILGINHAGTVAARTLKRLNKDIEVVAYERNDLISFLGCGIALWVKGEVKEPEKLFYASPELLQSEGISVHKNHEWIGINDKNKTVTIKNLDTNEQFEDNYDKLIVATGSWPILPPIPGVDLDGVQICKNYYHAQKIKKANEDKNIKNVAVIGAGYIGVELVDAFVESNKNVTLIDVETSIMPNYFDSELSNHVQKRMDNAYVNSLLGQKVIEFVGENGKLKQIKTDKTIVDVDYAVLSVGIKAQTQLLKGIVDLDQKGIVKTNQFMQSSNNDIYAIGDCAEVVNLTQDKNTQIALATTAVRSGILAAINIATNNTLPQMGFTGANAISVFDFSMASTGVSENFAKKLGMDYDSILFTDNDRPEFMSTTKPVWLKLLWDKKTRVLIGAQVGSESNHTEIIHMLSLAIQKKMTIDELPLVDMFFLPHFNKPYNFVTLAALEVLGLNYFKK